MNKWQSEKELAIEIVKYLKNNGWIVYPEIYDIDIVATKQEETSKNKLKIIGIECKKQFNLTVLSQAYEKSYLVDGIYIGIPDIRNKNQTFGLQVAKKFNIGTFLVKHKSFSYNNHVVSCYSNPEFSTRRYDKIDKLLDPKAENYAEAGQVGGRQWTLFKKTSYAIIEYVKLNPGLNLKEILKTVPHHYKTLNSATSCIKKMIEDQVIKDLKIIDGKIYLNL